MESKAAKNSRSPDLHMQRRAKKLSGLSILRINIVFKMFSPKGRNKKGERVPYVDADLQEVEQLLSQSVKELGEIHDELKSYGSLPQVLGESAEQLVTEWADKLRLLSEVRARAESALKDLLRPSELEEKVRALVSDWKIREQDRRLNAEFCGPRRIR